MYCGGLSYPDVPWTEAAAAAVRFTEGDFDWAAVGRHSAPTITPPTTKEVKFFPTVIGFLRLSPAFDGDVSANRTSRRALPLLRGCDRYISKRNLPGFTALEVNRSG